MKQENQPGVYWNDRFEKYGHTGWNDDLIYTYDQPLRVKAIFKALKQAKIEIGNTTNILDIGCGTGDLVLEFAKQGAAVIGIDISSEVINHTKTRIEKFSNVRIFVDKVEDLNLPAQSLDLITSVTVLQHVSSDDTLAQAVKNIARIAKVDAKVLILETSPVRKNSTAAFDPFFRVRTRNEWINVFSDNGFRLIGEVGLPQIGVRLIEKCNKLASFLFSIIFSRGQNRKRPDDFGPAVPAGHVASHPGLEKIRRSIFQIILRITWFFDSVSVPFPKSLTTLRIMIFSKIDEKTSDMA